MGCTDSKPQNNGQVNSDDTLKENLQAEQEVKQEVQLSKEDQEWLVFKVKIQKLMENHSKDDFFGPINFNPVQNKFSWGNFTQNYIEENIFQQLNQKFIDNFEKISPFSEYEVNGIHKIIEPKIQEEHNLLKDLKIDASLAARYLSLQKKAQNLEFFQKFLHQNTRQISTKTWREIDFITRKQLMGTQFTDKQEFTQTIEKILGIEYVMEQQNLNSKKQVTLLEHIDFKNQILFFQDSFCSLRDVLTLRSQYHINWLDNLNDISYLIVRVGHSIIDLASSNIYHDDITPENILIYRNECLLQYDYVLLGMDSLSYGFQNQKSFTPIYTPPYWEFKRFTSKISRVICSFYQLGRCVLELILRSIFPLIQESLHPEYQNFDVYMEHYFKNDKQNIKEALKLIGGYLQKGGEGIEKCLYLFFSLESTIEQLEQFLGILKVTQSFLQDESLLIEGVVQRRIIQNKNFSDFDDNNLEGVKNFMSFYQFNHGYEQAIYYLSNLGVDQVFRSAQLVSLYLFFLRKSGRFDCLKTFFNFFCNDEQIKEYYKQQDKGSYISICLEESFLWVEKGFSQSLEEEVFSKLYQLSRTMIHFTNYQCKIKKIKGIVLGKLEEIKMAESIALNNLKMDLDQDKHFQILQEYIDIIQSKIEVEQKMGVLEDDNKIISYYQDILSRYQSIQLTEHNLAYLEILKKIFSTQIQNHKLEPATTNLLLQTKFISDNYGEISVAYLQIFPTLIQLLIDQNQKSQTQEIATNFIMIYVQALKINTFQQTELLEMKNQVLETLSKIGKNTINSIVNNLQKKKHQTDRFFLKQVLIVYEETLEFLNQCKIE